MNSICVFHCTKGDLSEEQMLCLLVWLFEVPPSSIFIDGNKITVPSTKETRFIYTVCCTTHEAFRYSNPELLYTRYGIILRRFAIPYTTDRKGYMMLQKMAGGHPVFGDWSTSARSWVFEEGLGYRNSGITVPISSSGIKFQKGRRIGLGFKGKVTRDEDTPIRFVKSTH